MGYSSAKHSDRDYKSLALSKKGLAGSNRLHQKQSDKK